MNKVLIPGKVTRENELKTAQAYIQVKQKDESNIELSFNGKVVCFCGGGALAVNHPVCLEAVSLAKQIVAQGGLVVNGGENYGIMLAVSQALPEQVFGIACNYHQLTPQGPKVLIDNYFSRTICLSSLPNIIVFQGQIGTLTELVITLGWIKSSQKQQKNQITPKLYLSNFWHNFYQDLIKDNVVQEYVQKNVKLFSSVDEVLKDLWLTKRKF